jgi:hypothetical protein
MLRRNKTLIAHQLPKKDDRVVRLFSFLSIFCFSLEFSRIFHIQFARAMCPPDCNVTNDHWSSEGPLSRFHSLACSQIHALVRSIDLFVSKNVTGILRHVGFTATGICTFVSLARLSNVFVFRRSPIRIPSSLVMNSSNVL